MNKNIPTKNATMGATTHNHKEHTTATAPFHSAFFESLHKEQWQRVKLGEAPLQIIDGDRGKNYPKQNELFDNGYCLFLSTKNVLNAKFDFTECQFINKEKDEILRKGKLQIDDIVLTTRGTIGNIALYRENIDYKNIRINSGMVILRPDIMEVNSTFLLYAMLNSKKYIDNFVSGSAQPQLPIKDLSNLTIPLPPLETQHKIAEILSSLDDKIDLLHRQNKTLESLSLTLFRHTFIDNPKRNAWEEVTLNDICLKIASGGTPSTRIKEYYSGKINWYSTKELDDNFLFDSIQTITEDGLENSSAKLFPKDTIIIAIYAAPTVGRLGILTQDSAFNQAACGLIIDETKCSKEFVFCFLKNERENLNLLASGSAQQNLNVEKIKRYTLLLPDKATFHNFQIQAKGFFDKIYNNSKQIQNLESLRDIMLPKLLSGEMEV
ncbi:MULTISPECIES: restriction endonuclease subunit S [Helicobacter]|uniref:Restriction endonuclease subunit S n=1 Tax=Helicobacter ganmani TaxID=60246 RepID=A0A3D8IAU7_9HELI|nr:MULTISPECIES: restriction endonuclease subunit S [Helicobacter]RDU61884.1 restriction endonuclease subunit S [Helicobacter ganmani]